MAVPNTESSHSQGGGNATASGILFQASVASYFGAALLGERTVDRPTDLGRVVPHSIRVETEAPVDDILVETTAGGFIFIQAKTSVEFISNLASPLGKALQQFVRQWLVCASGSGSRGWDRPLSRNTDRLVLAVGPTSSDTVTRDLALALRAIRAEESAPLPGKQQLAIDRLRELLTSAWTTVQADQPTPKQISEIASLVDVLVFDFGGADRALVIESMRGIVQYEEDAASSFSVLQETFTRLMSHRLGVDAPGLRTHISSSIALAEPPSYRADVAQLRRYSEQTRKHLEHFETTKIRGNHLKIERKCTEAVVTSAGESILLVGDPGAGKSAVMTAAAKRLKNKGHEVIELAVDRLPVESAEGLQKQLGLVHDVVHVLENWPGSKPAFLFIDALDATRGGRSEGIFRWLISEILQMPCKRWRVVASIRSFDLRMGQQFARLFAGRPPDAAYSDPVFSAIKHIHIPTWEVEELEELLARAAPIADAVRAGGDRLFELARMPFNTRLLADLLSEGLNADAFSEVGTQSQLLDLYWAQRVRKHGLSAEVCLRNVVEQMVDSRSLQVERLTAAGTHAADLENLLRESVLMPVSGDRYIAFRHHILFDFSASRVYLDVVSTQSLTRVLSAEKSLGLMLGPALLFALNDLWSSSSEQREGFWRAILACVGQSSIDPVARSIAARVACESPRTRNDIEGLIAQLHRATIEPAEKKAALAHIMGSLAVRAEDKADIPIEPWSSLACELSLVVDQIGWPLRTLLFVLLERDQTASERVQLGSASRNLLRYALSDAEHLVAAAIGFVGDTYGTNPAASRELLASLFDQHRFEPHGHEDIPWLTRKLDPISAVDPEFVLEIYERTFACVMPDHSETSLGQSRILSLRSNQRQDFQMAQWSLKEFFPKFLRLYPRFGTQAYARTLRGHVLRNHPLNDSLTKHSVHVSGKTYVLQEDWSYVWASDPDEQHGDNAIEISQAFSTWFRSASREDIVLATEILISENELALVWARLFMVASERADILGPRLWPIATSSPFLSANDTRKDAIDLIAATYSIVPKEDRVAFERNALSYKCSEVHDSEKVREYFLKQLFGTVGNKRLETEEAKSFVTVTNNSGEDEIANNRPVSFRISSSDTSEYWWLRDRKVDTSAPENADVLARTTTMENDTQEQNRTHAFPNVETAVSKLTSFLADIDTHSEAHSLVASHAAGVAANTLEVIASMFEGDLKNSSALSDVLIAITERLSAERTPEVTPQIEQEFSKSAGWSSPASRVSAANAAMILGRLRTSTAERLQPTIERLSKDKHPAVRMSIATRLNALWTSDRSLMWKLSEEVVEQETNENVLAFFANSVLARLIHQDPEHVEALVTRLGERSRKEGYGKKLRAQIGGLIAILWVSHERHRAKAMIKQWLDSIVENVEELDQAISTLRGAVTLGYDSRSDREVAIRRRSIEQANWISEITAEKLTTFWAAPIEGTVQQEEAKISARLLHHVLSQLYFSSGAFRSSGNNDDARRVLTSVETKRQFLLETFPILERIAEIGGPETIHYLIDLLDFLMDADPEAVFDLVARALLGAGRNQGYHFESLGADQVVKIIGRFLADHRHLFDNTARRHSLIKCLDIFIEAGWPSARRLLYRLPELLQ